MSSALKATVKAVKRKGVIPRRAAIVLTQAAAGKVCSLLRGQPDASGLRIGVRARGCNGLSYTIDYANGKGKFDEEVNQDGARVFIDSKAQLTLLGTEMDYVSNKLSSEFVFNNPNVKGTCGCGESFTI
ncbi:iron-sulfur cluster assembly 1 homolog, mitochondrial-like [Corticium candelabrum]|uniref:iron-sulfur cluster assembly 1 homolog, mitochondrial-like n=1 Tax=Corticium candelabrum TaxID=121492 RepID=UPI002E277066|nr:iron-sulfur cluster assembly 1 homolog, mitochondrial-like [Corticium candelabrum]